MENLQDQFQQAKSLERAQKNDAALEVFLRLTGEDGPHLEDPGFWLHAGDLGRRTGKADVARDAYARAIELLEHEGQRNSALAIARRWTRTEPESPGAHLRFGTLAISLGYGRDGSTALLGALDLSSEDDVVDPAVDALRTAWSLLRRGGFHDEADSVRARLLEIRPSADPLDDPSLVQAAAPDHLDILDPTGEREDADAEPGLQPTHVSGVAEPEVDRLEGLEPTSAGGGWSSEDAEDDDESDDDLPDHPDLPLLRTGPEAEPPAHAPAEPLAGLMPTSEEAPDGDREEDDDSIAEAGELPLLSALPDIPVPADSREAADDDLVDEDIDDEDVGDIDIASEIVDGEIADEEADGEADDEITAEPAPTAVIAEPAASPAAAAEPRDDYIDLGALILDDDEDDTRFQMDAAQHPSGDEDRDFAEILGKFRQHVSEKIDPQDSTSHYDLGLAFKDMGLLDDAIGQLQVALRGGSNPVATIEVLGECFIEKGEHSLAARVLERATKIEGASDSDLIGVVYWLGRTSEVLGNPDDARGYYERVVSVDISFRDAGARLDSLRGAPSPESDT